MRVPAIVGPVLLAAITAWAGEVEPILQRTVRICMNGPVGAPWIVAQAKATAARMFAEVGVKLEWHQRERDCQAGPESSIVIGLSIDTPTARLPGALAYALPYASPSGRARSEVFYDRVLQTVEPARVPSLLAHVLAHEIAHILQGIGRHSDAGVMKAHWDDRDYLEMAWKPLPFTPEDAQLIRHGIDSRASRLAQAGGPPTASTPQVAIQ